MPQYIRRLVFRLESPAGVYTRTGESPGVSQQTLVSLVSPVNSTRTVESLGTSSWTGESPGISPRTGESPGVSPWTGVPPGVSPRTGESPGISVQIWESSGISSKTE